MFSKNNFLETTHPYQIINFRNSINTYKKEIFERKCSLCFQDSIFYELKIEFEDSIVNNLKEIHLCCEDCEKHLKKQKNSFYCMIHLKEHKCSELRIIKK